MFCNNYYWSSQIGERPHRMWQEKQRTLFPHVHGETLSSYPHQELGYEVRHEINSTYPHFVTIHPITSSHPPLLNPSQGPEHCNTCRNYYIEEMMGAGSLVKVCVEACPLGTYLNTSSSECVPCDIGCQKDVGCAGPLPYVNKTHGCLECDRVKLDMEGNQVSECVHAASIPPYTLAMYNIPITHTYTLYIQVVQLQFIYRYIYTSNVHV